MTYYGKMKVAIKLITKLPWLLEREANFPLNSVGMIVTKKLT